LSNAFEKRSVMVMGSLLSFGRVSNKVGLVLHRWTRVRVPSTLKQKSGDP